MAPSVLLYDVDPKALDQHSKRFRSNGYEVTALSNPLLCLKALSSAFAVICLDLEFLTSTMLYYCTMIDANPYSTTAFIFTYKEVNTFWKHQPRLANLSNADFIKQ